MPTCAKLHRDQYHFMGSHAVSHTCENRIEALLFDMREPLPIQDSYKIQRPINISCQSFSIPGWRKPEKRSSNIYVSTTSAKQATATCSLYKNNFHPLYRCQKFQQVSTANRFSFIRKQNLCVNCLKLERTAKTCKLGLWIKYNKKHNLLLHLESNTQSSNQRLTSERKSNKTSSFTTY